MLSGLMMINYNVKLPLHVVHKEFRFGRVSPSFCHLTDEAVVTFDRGRVNMSYSSTVLD